MAGGEFPSAPLCRELTVKAQARIRPIARNPHDPPSTPGYPEWQGIVCNPARQE